MKVCTNLSPKELAAVGEGLKTLAKGQREHSLPLENAAEKELLRKIDSTFTIMLESFQREVSDILLDKK